MQIGDFLCFAGTNFCNQDRLDFLKCIKCRQVHSNKPMSGGETEILGNLFKYYIFCFILLYTSSSPYRKDQFAVSYFSWIFLLGINFCYFQKVPDKSLLIFSFLLGKCNGNTYFQTIQQCAYSLPRRRYKGTGKGEFVRTRENVKRKFSSSLIPRPRSRALIRSSHVW